MEGHVINFIKDEMLSDKSIETIVETIFDMVDKALEKNIGMKDELTAKRNDLKAQVERLIDLYALGGIDREALSERIKYLNERIANYESRLSLETSKEFTHLNRAKMHDYLNELRAKIEGADDKVKKVVIDLLIEKIIIYQDDIKVIFKVGLPKENDGQSIPSTGDSSGGDEPCLILPYVFTRTEIYEYM